MNNIHFDFTTYEGLLNAHKSLEDLDHSSKMHKSGKLGAFFIHDIFKNLFSFVSQIVDRFFDLFDDTKKLEKQMEAAQKTIEYCRAAGAKSIEITINAKNNSKLKVYLTVIDAKIGGELIKDNTIKYVVIF